MQIAAKFKKHTRIESKPTLNDMLDEMRKSPIFCKYQEAEDWRDHDSSHLYATKDYEHNNPEEYRQSHSHHTAPSSSMNGQFKKVSPRYKRSGFNNKVVMKKARKDQEERLAKSSQVCSRFLFGFCLLLIRPLICIIILYQKWTSF